VQRSEEVFQAEDEPKDTLHHTPRQQERATRPSHDDVKSSEEEGVLIRLPGGAGRPSHDDVKSFVQRSEEVFLAEDEP